MNIFNRIVVMLLFVFVIVFSIVAIVNKFADLFIWNDISNRTISSIASINHYITALILSLIVIISIFLIALEFYRRKISSANISDDKSGKSYGYLNN